MIGTFIGGLLLGHRAEFNFVAGTGCDLGHLSGRPFDDTSKPPRFAASLVRISPVGPTEKSSRCNRCRLSEVVPTRFAPSEAFGL